MLACKRESAPPQRVDDVVRAASRDAFVEKILLEDLEIPEDLKEMVPALRKVVKTVQRQVERERLGGGVKYASFEGKIAAGVREVERKAHQVALGALDIDAPKLLINGVPHTRVLEGMETTFYSQVGEVAVTRGLYRPAGERNAPTVDVVALRAGAIEGVWLPTIQAKRQPRRGVACTASRRAPSALAIGGKWWQSDARRDPPGPERRLSPAIHSAWASP